MKHKGVTFGLNLLLLLQGVFLWWCKNHPEWIEAYYARGYYPHHYELQKWFFKALPFSLGDVLYGLVIVLVIRALYLGLKKRPFRIVSGFFSLTAGLSLLSLIFHLSWGLNYYRIPLHQQLNYETKYDEESLSHTLQALIEVSNQFQIRLTENDTVPVSIPYTKDQILAMITKEFRFESEFQYLQPHAKNALWSIPLSYMGYAGYLNPFTLESQVNKGLPELSYITTTAHEMAHQLGIAAENEANFIAFYVTINHSNPFIQFAGYTFALRYTYSELFKANPEKAKTMIKKLHPGIFKNFSTLSDYWKKYENPFEPYLKKGYDSYLKANGQAQGIQSYNEMVALVIAYHKKAPFLLQP